LNWNKPDERATTAGGTISEKYTGASTDEPPWQCDEEAEHDERRQAHDSAQPR